MNSELPSDKEMREFLSSQGYERFRKLPDGEWILIVPLFYSLSVCCGCDKSTMFKYRWCFGDPAEALAFFESCENYDDIPNQKDSLVGHRYDNQPLLMLYDQYGLPRW